MRHFCGKQGRSERIPSKVGAKVSAGLCNSLHAIYSKGRTLFGKFVVMRVRGIAAKGMYTAASNLNIVVFKVTSIEMSWHACSGEGLSSTEQLCWLRTNFLCFPLLLQTLQITVFVCGFLDGDGKFKRPLLKKANRLVPSLQILNLTTFLAQGDRSLKLPVGPYVRRILYAYYLFATVTLSSSSSKVKETCGDLFRRRPSESTPRSGLPVELFSAPGATFPIAKTVSSFGPTWDPCSPSAACQCHNLPFSHGCITHTLAD